jgi:hypothetical protein
MCNLYSLTKSQAAIIAIVHAMTGPATYRHCPASFLTTSLLWFVPLRNSVIGISMSNRPFTVREERKF